VDEESCGWGSLAAVSILLPVSQLGLDIGASPDADAVDVEESSSVIVPV